MLVRQGRLIKGVYDALLVDIPLSICKHDPFNIIVNEIKINSISGLVFKSVECNLG